jgi:hypothetical protein
MSAAIAAPPTATPVVTPVATAQPAGGGTVDAVQSFISTGLGAPGDPAPEPPPVLQTSWYQWSSDVQNTTQKLVIAITIYMSAIFGGIIAVQYAIKEGMSRRFLSFLYGSAWYPLSLAYAIYKPPAWHATVFPYKEGAPGAFTFAPLGPQSTKGSTTLRIVSLILLAFNVYVAAILIQVRFYI